ncbi:unnamed protein product [Trifolium pratense]|uniref:Uncharacterized protein n=1 Tax=Trifolium pratense TaxID=57577 RepID=A0ACB0L662_TRIPR|nr:unnamed protein product [Trifolium pratense]
MEFQWFWMCVATLLACYIFFYKIVRNLNDWYYDLKLGKKQYHQLPPGDMGWPLIGNQLPFYKYFSSGQGNTFINNIVLKYGQTGIYKAHLYGSPRIIVIDPTLVKKVMNDDVNFKASYPKGTNVLGRSRYLNREHKRFKKLVTSPIVGQNTLVMYLERIEDIVLDKLEELSTIKHHVELLKEMKKVSFKIIFHIYLYSCDQNIVMKFGDLFNVMSATMFYLMPIDAPGFAFRKALKARKKMIKIIQSIIDERKAVIEENGQMKEKKDLLDIFLGMTDEMGEKLDDEDMIDLLITLLFAGHETSALAMVWSITFLTQHPLCLKKAKEEQEEIMKERPSSQKRLCITEIKKMVYLSQVIDETLRNMTLFSTFREATADVNIDGYFIPKGWKVMPWIRAVHMNPQYHSNPEEFNPARWNDFNSTKGTFLPFGWGRRLCPGRDLARFELTVFLHYFLMNYKLELKNPECPVTHFPALKQLDNCLAKITKLSSDLN